jgi:hypothetical protein
MAESVSAYGMLDPTLRFLFPWEPETWESAHSRQLAAHMAFIEA